jgi:formylglycine-generating enzyme required for sulfatase activity
MAPSTTRRLFSLGTILALSTLLVALCVVHASAVTIPTVPVGNAGNAGELSGGGAGGEGPDAIVGGVSYDYRIGTTEVTNAQYAEFLNAKAASDPLALYNTLMGVEIGGITRSGSSGSYTYSTIGGRENMPVVAVSWYSAIRFANWLHNGQGSGDTETGAYTLLGGTPTPSNGLSITRNTGALWFLPSEDEWYKAAYHKNDGVTGNYFDYPTSSDSAPIAEAPPGGSNSANYGGFAAVGDLTNGGAYTASDSPYGTFDQGGNVWEWNEAIILGSFRGLRGGSWGDPLSPLRASFRFADHPFAEFSGVGFRVATIPEPGTAVLTMIGCVLMLLWRRRPK